MTPLLSKIMSWKRRCITITDHNNNDEQSGAYVLYKDDEIVFGSMLGYINKALKEYSVIEIPTEGDNFLMEFIPN
jgi:hypothetical protein